MSAPHAHPGDLHLGFPERFDLALGTLIGLTAAAILGHWWAVPAWLGWGILMGRISGVDFRELRIPNELVAIGVVMTLPLLALATIGHESTSRLSDASLIRAVAGAFAGLGIYLALNLVAGVVLRGGSIGLGMGDVKLAFVIGAYLAFVGWGPWFFGLFFLSFLCQAVIGLGLIATRKATLKTAIPFGPFMVLGAVLALLPAFS